MTVGGGQGRTPHRVLLSLRPGTLLERRFRTIRVSDVNRPRTQWGRHTVVDIEAIAELADAGGDLDRALC